MADNGRNETGNNSGSDEENAPKVPKAASAKLREKPSAQTSQAPSTRKPMRKIAVHTAALDVDAPLRGKIKKIAEAAISATEKIAEISGRGFPAYLHSFEGYRGLVERSKTLDAFRSSVTETYRAHRSDIISEEVDGLWLSEAKIPVRWTITPREAAKTKEFENFYLDLSKGFRNAMSVADYVAENGEAAETDSDRNLPELYLLHLYQVFHEVADDKEDKRMIEDIISALSPASTPSPSSVLGGISSENVQSIVTMAMDVIKGLGVEVGDLDSEAVASKISNVAKNPALGQLMNSVGRDLKTCRSPKDVVDVLVKQAAPGTKTELQAVMGQIKEEMRGQGPPSSDEKDADK